MKQVLLLLSFSVFFQFFSFSVSYAQTSDFQKSFSDYQNVFNQYQDAHLAYTKAKSEYLSYQSLASETKALESTKKMLSLRDETMALYFQTLGAKMSLTLNIPNYNQNLLSSQLDDENLWLASHRNSLPSVATITDLVNKSREMEQRYPKMEIISYQTLGAILSGKENTSRESLKNEIRKVRELFNQMKAEGENVDKLERWIMEAEQKISRSEEKQKEAEKIIKDLSGEQFSRRNKFLEASRSYEESNQYLKESNSFLLEVVKDIKEQKVEQNP